MRNDPTLEDIARELKLVADRNGFAILSKAEQTYCRVFEFSAQWSVVIDLEKFKTEALK